MARGPSYPSMSLEEAIKRTRKFFEASKRYPVSRSDDDPVAYKSLGFGGANGTSKRALSSVLAFGLLEKLPGGEDSKVRVSDAGYEIIALKPDDPKLPKLIAEAARKPKIYRDLLTEFHDGLPPSDTPIHSSLLKRGIVLGSIPELIRDFRATVHFAKLTAEGNMEADVDDDDDDIDDDGESERLAEEARRKADELRCKGDHLPRVGMRSLTIPMPGEREAILEVPTPMTAEDFTFLESYLGLMKGALVSKAPVVPVESGKEDDKVV